MTELGRNPARIIPAVEAMLARHPGQTLHYVGEPVWPERSPEEIRQATRHEALINLAWPQTPIRVLCAYDSAALPEHVLADAEATHPHVIHGPTRSPRARRTWVRGCRPAVTGRCRHRPRTQSASSSGSKRSVCRDGWFASRRPARASPGADRRSRACGQRARRQHDPVRAGRRHAVRLVASRPARVPGPGLWLHQRSARGPARAPRRAGGRRRAVGGEPALRPRRGAFELRGHDDPPARGSSAPISPAADRAGAAAAGSSANASASSS